MLKSMLVNIDFQPWLLIGCQHSWLTDKQTFKVKKYTTTSKVSIENLKSFYHVEMYNDLIWILEECTNIRAVWVNFQRWSIRNICRTLGDAHHEQMGVTICPTNTPLGPRWVQKDPAFGLVICDSTASPCLRRDWYTNYFQPNWRDPSWSSPPTNMTWDAAIWFESVFMTKHYYASR